MQKLLYVTSNPFKARQLSRHLDWPVEHVDIDLIEIQSLDVKEVAERKAKEAYELLRQPVIVDDFSIVYAALGGLPGPFIKWFLKELKVHGLCKMLDGFDDRTATVQSAVAYADEHGSQIFYAERKGRIAKEPRGDTSFGSTSIFIPDGWDKTWSEMTDQEQTEASLRRPALLELKAFLSERYKRPPQP